MPLAKIFRKGKKNQGAQWGNTGSPGNIHTVDQGGGSDPHIKDGPRSNSGGRDASVGRGKREVRKSHNPE